MKPISDHPSYKLWHKSEEQHAATADPVDRAQLLVRRLFGSKPFRKCADGLPTHEALDDLDLGYREDDEDAMHLVKLQADRRELHVILDAVPEPACSDGLD